VNALFEQSTIEASTEEQPPKPANPQHIRRDFYRLALDWIDLHTHLHTPTGIAGRKAKHREYGHQAQWASDKTAQIAAMFHDWHDLLAEHRNETPPPPTTTAEITRVTAGWRYIEPRIEQLCTIVEPEALKEIRDLHYQIVRILGYNNPPQTIITPCTNCGMRTLLRHIRVGNSYVQCGNDECGWITTDDHYNTHRQFYARVVLDTLISLAT
jgi:hypothetical protein